MRIVKFGVIACVLAAALAMPADGAERKIKITKRYLNFPVSHSTDRHVMTIAAGSHRCSSQIRLAEAGADYWVFADMNAWRGKTATINYDGPEAALERIVLSDTIFGTSEMYKERLRPQFHFTTRRGWINDPNGLVYLDGTWHLFYQHNPFERNWGNMHWGHAVSADLVHWKELPDALHPDSLGTMFSGSAVYDKDNTSGFGEKGNAPLVFAYTADSPEAERQCIAYSTDGGLTLTKYSANPVVDSHQKWQSHDTRDPKLLWYAPGKHWVMVLNERNGNSIYTSGNLKDWTYSSHITGFWECPELFEIAVEGNPGERKWVMWGASGTYMVGDFDGKTFRPLTPKLQNVSGSGYAAQTFSNIPATDGRIIKMTWATINFDGMPFNGAMLMPQEQVLSRSALGQWQLKSRPVKEMEQVFTCKADESSLTVEEANRILERFNSDILRIKATLELTYATDAGLAFHGQRLVDYNMNWNRINGQFYSPAEPGSMKLNVDVYVDRGMAEVFVDGGAYSYSLPIENKPAGGNGYLFWGNEMKVERLQVYSAKSIWQTGEASAEK